MNRPIGGNAKKMLFLEDVKAGRVPPLAAEIPYCDAHLLYQSIVRSRGSSDRSVLFESLKGNEKIAVHSIIAFDPYMEFRVKDGEVRTISLPGGKETLSFRDPLDRLGELLRAYPQKPTPGLPPFQGGAIGMISYDFVRYIEDIPANSLDDLGTPDAHFLLVDKVITFDHMQRRAWVIVSPGARQTELGFRDITTIDWVAAYDEAEDVLNDILALVLSADRDDALSPETPAGQALDIIYEMKKEHYMDMVRRAKEYIAAGDIFQANLSQRIAVSIGALDPWEIYRVLRTVNPSPFAGYVDFGGYRIVSSSPERLVRLRSGVIDTRPIAGTRPRGRDLSEDDFMRSELLLNEKERAEHIMLIDLERNDIGRVSAFGTVYVDELMITEDYSHVIHIVSNVRGELREGKTCFDLIRATFPGGTITGVPKVRCMEIIDELEPVRRGVYTGSLGYIGFSGDMDLNIIIRTFMVRDGFAYVQVGAGIVADSDPEREYYETLRKAEGLLKTVRTLNRRGMGA